MNLHSFLAKYQGRENLSEIPWNDFPDELKRATQRFIDEWKAGVEIDNLRRLSGFNEMHIEDLLAYARGELDEGTKPLGWPYK